MAALQKHRERIKGLLPPWHQRGTHTHPSRALSELFHPEPHHQPHPSRAVAQELRSKVVHLEALHESVKKSATESELRLLQTLQHMTSSSSAGAGGDQAAPSGHGMEAPAGAASGASETELAAMLAAERARADRAKREAAAGNAKAAEATKQLQAKQSSYERIVKSLNEQVTA